MSFDASATGLGQWWASLQAAVDSLVMSIVPMLPQHTLGPLLLPPALPLLVIALGLLLLSRFPSTGRLAAWIGLIAAWLLATGAGASQMAAWAEGGSLSAQTADSLRDALSRPNPPQAVVIIGGGSRRDARERPDPETVKPGTLERLVYGAWVARITKLPVLVSGGVPRAGRSSEAALMKRVLEDDLNTPVRWVEGASDDTAANASLSAELLKGAGITRIVLVTEAYHMPRALVSFEREGLSVLPAPCAFAGSPVDFGPLRLLPSGEASFLSYRAGHELLGRLWYRIRARASVADGAPRAGHR